MKSYMQRKIQQKYRKAKKVDKKAEILEAAIVVMILVLLVVLSLKTQTVPVKVEAPPNANLISVWKSISNEIMIIK
ncbi:hypothetical protein AUC31_01905 [Planococcus rifietoensis]|uniref:Uncharacterized protein n=1 Tax=Planococcus rifietoensis TaxID=200991 RepID=A0A0U2J6J6_9BACL|nr:hypothetical protein [Planococcus rifietoensis]ALS74082.1 hypothetical protein AUC31_01905 [Planococcus rifietoensis]